MLVRCSPMFKIPDSRVPLRLKVRLEGWLAKPMFQSGGEIAPPLATVCACAYYALIEIPTI